MSDIGARQLVIDYIDHVVILGPVAEGRIDPLVFIEQSRGDIQWRQYPIAPDRPAKNKEHPYAA